jgi:ribosome biogenesis GTPase A
LLPHRNDEFTKPIRAMIMGIPNVGKSTMINLLAGKPIAKVGNEPAVTKSQQKINLGNGIILSDTPGILWPRMESEDFGYRLAITGAIKNTAIEYEEVALYAAAYLLKAYPAEIQARYKLNELPQDDYALLEMVARKRGGLRAGGVIDYHKASEVLLNDFRNGAIGRLSLETPAMVVPLQR